MTLTQFWLDTRAAPHAPDWLARPGDVLVRGDRFPFWNDTVTRIRSQKWEKN